MSLIQRTSGRRAVLDRLKEVSRIEVACGKSFLLNRVGLLEFELELWQDERHQGHLEAVQDAQRRFMVRESDAERGWGGLLYQAALEMATKAGRGLMSDRWDVSSNAREIWWKFAERAKVKAGVRCWRMRPWPGAAKEIKQHMPPNDFEENEETFRRILRGMAMQEREGGVAIYAPVFWAETDWRKDPTAFLYAATEFPVMASGKLEMVGC